MTSKNRKLVALTRKLLSILRAKGLLGRYSKCCSCGKELSEGDVVLSVASYRRGRSKKRWYCLNCAKRLGVWSSKAPP